MQKLTQIKGPQLANVVEPIKNFPICRIPRGWVEKRTYEKKQEASDETFLGLVILHDSDNIIKLNVLLAITEILRPKL